MTSRLSSTARSRLLAVAVAGLCFLPFLGKAVHIDDRIYLEIADQILRDPLYPYDYSPVFEGLVSSDAASHSHLPLTSYYLALIELVGGGAIEWMLHLGFFVFPVIAVLPFHDLAGHYVSHRLALTLLLVVSPAFLVLGQTLMPDVPLLAFWLLSLSRLLRILKGDNTRSNLVVLSVGLVAAAFLSLLSAGLLLLIAVVLMAGRSGGSPDVRRFASLLLLVPLLLWGAWYLRAYLHYDRLVLINTLLHMEKRETFDWTLLGLKLGSFVINVGAVFLCPLALWLGFAGRWRTRIALLTAMLAFFPFSLWIEGWEWGHVALLALFLASGFLLIWEFAELGTDRNPETMLLLLWFLGILAACLLLFYAGSVRYVLLALPPSLIVWGRRVERSGWGRRTQQGVLAAGVILTALYALPLAVADYQLAGFYRYSARQLMAEYAMRGRQVWFTGEWGFRYYMEQEGGRLMTRGETGAEPGDIIIKPYIASPWVTVFDGNERTTLLEQRTAQHDPTIRLLDFASHAGFYSTAWGLLPVSLSSGGDWEWFNVFRIDRRYQGPIPEQERHF